MRRDELNGMIRIRTGTPDDFDRVADLIHASTNAWYKTNRGAEIFACAPHDCRLFPETYAALPGSSLLIAENDAGELVGSCFQHIRETHVSLGILNVSPAHFGQGTARALVESVIETAGALKKTVRLVSSLMNLDSFSLYSRLGFAPQRIFQDMMLSVPENGMAFPAPDYAGTIRPAVGSDVEKMARVEKGLCGIHRPGDWTHFVENPSGIWKTFVAVSGYGNIVGALSSHAHPASNLIGPGFARDEGAMIALLWAQLDARRGTSPVFLVPTNTQQSLRTAYQWGARNVELHATQCWGGWRPIYGVVMPTFLPETF